MAKVTVIRPGKDADKAKKVQAEAHNSLPSGLLLATSCLLMGSALVMMLWEESHRVSIFVMAVVVAFAITIYTLVYVIPTNRYKKLLDNKTVVEVDDPQILALVNGAWGVRDEWVRRYETGVYDDVLRLTALKQGDGESPDVSAEVAELLRVRSALLHQAPTS